MSDASVEEVKVRSTVSGAYSSFMSTTMVQFIVINSERELRRVICLLCRYQESVRRTLTVAVLRRAIINQRHLIVD